MGTNPNNNGWIWHHVRRIVSWISEALSDMDDTGLVDVFGYGGMRYRFSALREIYRYGNMPTPYGIGLKVGVTFLR